MPPKAPKREDDLDEALDPDLDEIFELDLEDEEPDDDDDLGFDDEWPDTDVPLEDLDAPEPDGALPDLDDDLLYEGPDEWELLDADERTPTPVGPHQVVLPWSVRAEIPALALSLPAILDPTRADSVWIVPREPDRAEVDVLIALHGVEVRAHLRVIVGDDPGLRLGRDTLGPTIVVASTDP